MNVEQIRLRLRGGFKPFVLHIVSIEDPKAKAA